MFSSSIAGRLTFVSAQHNHLGWMVIVTPVIAALLWRHGQVRHIENQGHGIPEAMEAVLFNRSRIAPRVAILKPISAAIAIGTGGHSVRKVPSFKLGSDRFARRPGLPHHCGGTQSFAGVRRCRRNVSHV